MSTSHLQSQSDAKNFFSVVFESAVCKWKIAFQRLSVSGPCFWFNFLVFEFPMALNRTETACWITSNSLSSNFFGCPERGLSSTLKSSSLKRRNHSLHGFISWSSVTIISTSIVRYFAALFFQLKQKIKTSRKCCLVDTKFNNSNTVKIKVFVWNSKRYKLNIISRCLISLKSPKLAVIMNHS